MTLDEAIQHCEEKALCGNACGLEHKQLAEWLKELKRYRMDEEIEAAYDKAYDEIEKYLAENRKEYDLDKWTQNSEWGGIESVEIIEKEID